MDSRLTDDARKAWRWSGPQGKHRAKAVGRHTSQVSREESGIRRSALAEVEADLRGLARHAKCDPASVLLHLEVAVSEEGGEPGPLRSLLVAETEAQGAADVAALALLDGATPDEIEAAHDALFLHGVTIKKAIAALRRMRGAR